MIACYCRVSSARQKTDSQKPEIRRWLDGNRIDPSTVGWFEDKEIGEDLETSRVRPAPEGHLRRDGHDGRGLEAGPDLPWPARRREPAGRLVRARGPCGRRDPADRPERAGRPDGGERAVRAGGDRDRSIGGNVKRRGSQRRRSGAFIEAESEARPRHPRAVPGNSVAAVSQCRRSPRPWASVVGQRCVTWLRHQRPEPRESSNLARKRVQARQPSISRRTDGEPLFQFSIPSLLTGQAVPLGEITGQQFDATFDLNVRGTLFTVQKAWRPFNVFCEFTDIFCVETV